MKDAIRWKKLSRNSPSGMTHMCWVLEVEVKNVHPTDEIFEYFQLETAKPNTIAK